MPKKAILFLVSGMDGGTATLSHRIGKFYKNKAFDVFYLCQTLNNENNYKTLISDFNVIICKEGKWNSKIKNIIYNYDEIIAFAYTFEFIHHFRKFSKYAQFSYYLYAVRFDCLVYGANRKKQNFLYRIINPLNIPLIKSIYNNHHLLFMDEGIVDTTKKNIKIDFVDIDKYLFFLPYEVNGYEKKSFVNDLSITTMCRVEFPFKGYLVGLIDTFDRITKQYESSTLSIIGDGSDFNKLEEIINSYPSNVRDKITLYGRKSFDEALEIIKESKVFVGMGTGILDASAVCVPSICVAVNTYDCLSKGFFADNFNLLGYDSNDYSLRKIDNELIELQKMNDNQYLNECQRGYEILKKYYSFDSFATRLPIPLKENFKDKLCDFVHLPCLLIFKIYNLFKCKRR